MTEAPFAHIGGAVVADHGPLSLAAARALIAFYAAEAAIAAAAGREAASALCRRRAGALCEAVRGACVWRRAAGWSDPDAADR